MRDHLTQHQLTEKFYELTMLFELEARQANQPALARQGQGNILLALGQEDHLPQKELVNRLQISAPSTTEFVNKLISKGLVTKSKSAEDKRMTVISLTKAGRATANKMQQTELAGWQYLTEDQQKQFADLLDIMITGLNHGHSDKNQQAEITKLKRKLN